MSTQTLIHIDGPAGVSIMTQMYSDILCYETKCESNSEAPCRQLLAEVCLPPSLTSNGLVSLVRIKPT